MFYCNADWWLILSAAVLGIYWIRGARVVIELLENHWSSPMTFVVIYSCGCNLKWIFFFFCLPAATNTHNNLTLHESPKKNTDKSFYSKKEGSGGLGSKTSPITDCSQWKNVASVILSPRLLATWRLWRRWPHVEPQTQWTREELGFKALTWHTRVDC